ncbi:hypothetical protein H5410_007215, partial [Solanum commersonii]
EMSGFTLVTLRWYHGGVLDLSSGQLVYSGGQVTEFLDVDDTQQLAHLVLNLILDGILEDIHNDMDILDLSYSLEDGDIVEVYVKHLIDDAVVDPTLILLENVPHGDMEESGSTFNKVNEQSGVEKEGYDYSTEDSVESECGLVGDDDEDYGSDVHEEVRELRVEKDLFKEEKEKRVPVILKRYQGEIWSDLGFDETQTQVKCDSVDNNMSECFNSWILAARHKTIITMLDEIRVKMMTRIAKLREFTNTWMSVNCNIEFNGVDGFEVKEGPFQHSVDLGRWTCSCRVWQLKGIPCLHLCGTPFTLRNVNLLTTLTSCYRDVALYLLTLRLHHEIKACQRGAGKLRKKEGGESKNQESYLEAGLAMTCSSCNVRGHNREDVHKGLSHQQGKNHQI